MIVSLSKQPKLSLLYFDVSVSLFSMKLYSSIIRKVFSGIFKERRIHDFSIASIILPQQFQ